MHARAHVDSVEAVKQFRPALWRFAEEVRSALGDAQADVQRTLHWLEQEQGPWWVTQCRKRQEAVNQARRALDEKRLYRSADGGRPSTVEEEEALKLAQRRLDEAVRRLDAVKRWRRQLEREAQQYHASAQRLARAVDTDIPNAAATLDRLLDALEQYLALQTPQTRPAPTEAGAGEEEDASMGLPASLVLDDPPRRRGHFSDQAASDQAGSDQTSDDQAGSADSSPRPPGAGETPADDEKGPTP